MNIVILNGSPRVKGNTEILASAFKKGAEEAGHDVTLINLRGMNIKGCLGCQYCFYLPHRFTGLISLRS